MIRCFTLNNGTLDPGPRSPPEPDTLLSRIIVGLPRQRTDGWKELRLIAKLRDDIAVTESYEWRDGSAIFDITTSKLRTLLNPTKTLTHASIQKWEVGTQWRPTKKEIWRYGKELGKHCCQKSAVCNGRSGIDLLLLTLGDFVVHRTRTRGRSVPDASMGLKMSNTASGLAKRPNRSGDGWNLFSRSLLRNLTRLPHHCLSSTH